jgi:hypothetical protein
MTTYQNRESGYRGDNGDALAGFPPFAGASHASSAYGLNA